MANDELDVDKELVGATQEAEAAPEGITEEAETGESAEEASTGESVEESAAAEAAEDDADALKPFRRDDGSVDTDKLAKSYREAQKLVGKTAKDREAVKGLEERAKAFDAWDALVQQEPEIAQAIQRVQAKRSGVQVREQEPEVKMEDVAKKHHELMAAGKYFEAQELAIRHSPVVKELAETKRKLESFERAEAERRDKDEYEGFKRKYEGVLFGKDGTIADRALYDETRQAIQELGPNARSKYESALILAAARLDRPLKAKPNPDKKVAAQLPTNNRGQTRTASQRKGAHENRIDSLGISERALLGGAEA